jgi:uncharacterized protein (UPF0276 family)
MLELIRQDYPLALHGVGLSIASSSGLNLKYLTNLKNLVHRIEPFIVSDHLCWTGTASHNIHDLLPFPFTNHIFEQVCEKISIVQEFLQRTIVLENVSSYLLFANSEFSEWDFLAKLAKKTGCCLLLDLNNVFVNSRNHGFDAETFIANIPSDAIAQIHLAGHTDTGEYLFDPHSKPVCEEVWDLYTSLSKRMLKIPPTLIEWDADIPPFERLEEEALKAKTIWMENNGRKFPGRPTEQLYAVSGLQ